MARSRPASVDMSAYDTILSAKLHTRFVEEVRVRPTLILPPEPSPPPEEPDGDSSSAHQGPGPSSSSHRPDASTSSSTPTTSTPHPNGYLPTRNGDARHTNGDSHAYGSSEEVDVAGGATRMLGSEQHSHEGTFKPRLWISLWFFLTIPVIFWDAGYCFMRPRSMVGGDMHWIWSPYALYQDIDYVYGLPALERGDGFTNAQSLLNIIENLMNIYYLYLAHYVNSPTAPVLGFASATMTLSKTFLYWAQEYYCGLCAVGHNDLKTLLLLWVLPNGLWLLVPSFIVYRFAKDISASLRVAAAIKEE
ncbi:hypothetical protein EIP91_012194 [Steccherinum ochraceum]|uniref:EXPERA domain-containing protein n=1 Tax=Steccherinum ochraceum TaxID=92696 RepID=A0A4R0RQG5_9APHY|nr:hypothetical protein EIP91_012194 [Steccherinum ochraceum]